MNSHRFEDASKSVFALCPGITALDEMGRFAVDVSNFILSVKVLNQNSLLG